MKPETLRENLKGYVPDELIDQILQDQKLRGLVNDINWEEAIEHLHRYDIISPYSKKLREQLVDLHYKLVKIKEIGEENVP